MFIASLVASLVLAVLLAVSAWFDAARLPRILEAMDRTGVPRHMLPAIGAVKAVAVVGLLVGLAVPTVGIAAAAGAVVFFVLAVLVHLRVGDRAVGPALSFGGVAVVALALAVASQALDAA